MGNESLEARIAKLEEELKKLKEEVKAAEGKEAVPELREETAPPVEETIEVAPPVEEIAPPIEEIPQEPAFTAPPAKSSWEVREQVREKWLQLERMIGERWLVWVGALVFATGFGIFLKIAFEQGWLNEVARFILGLLGGFVLIGLAEYFYKKKFEALAQGLSALGLIILCLTIFIACHFYHILTPRLSFLLFFVVTIGGMTIAMLHNAFPTAFLSIFGAFSTPVLFASPDSPVYYLFSYLLIINLGVLYVSSVKRWRALSFFSFLCTVIYFGAWYLTRYTSADFSLAAGFATTYFILFSFISTFYSIIWKKKSNWEDVLLVILNPLIFFIIGYKMLIDRGANNIAPYIPLSMAIYHFILAATIRKINAKDIFLYFGFIGTAIGLLTLPVPMTVKSYWITVAWGVEASLLILAGSILDRKSLRIGGLAVFFLVITRLFYRDFLIPYHSTDHYLLFLNLKFLALLLSTLTFGVGALSFSKFKNITPEERVYAGTLWTVFSIVLFWATNVEIFSYFSTLGGIAGNMKWAYSTVFWSVFFCWLILHGVFKKIKVLRIAGMCLMGATAAKILLLDTPILYNYHQYGYPFLFNLKFLSQAMFLGCVFGSAFLYGRRHRKGEQFTENALGFLWGTFASMLFLSLNFEIFSYFGQIKVVEIRMLRLISTTLLWTGFSYWFFLSGILRNDYNLRRVGFFLIGITSLKLFLVDTPLLYDYSYGYPFLLNLKFLSVVFLLSAIASSALICVRKEVKLEPGEKAVVPILWSLFIFLLFLALNVEIVSYFGRSLVPTIKMESFIFTTMLWSIFSFFLISLGVKQNITYLRVGGFILITVTFLKLILVDLIFLYPHSYGYPFLLNLKFLSAATLLFVLAYAASLYTEKKVQRVALEKKAVPYLWCLFLILLFIELHSQATLSFYRIWNVGEQRAAFALSLLWVVYGFGLLLAGIIKKILPLRIAALSLFGATLLKVFFVDLRFTGKLYKMYILLGIGSIFLIAAYFYRKYRRRD